MYGNWKICTRMFTATSWQIGTGENAVNIKRANIFHYIHTMDNEKKEENLNGYP